MGNGFNDTWVSHGNITKPMKPTDLGLPTIIVSSEGKTKYKPRFTLASEGKGLIMQFGFYYAGGSYFVSTLLEGKTVGLDLYGSDKELDSIIDFSEMKKLRRYLTENKCQIRKQLLLKGKMK